MSYKINSSLHRRPRFRFLKALLLGSVLFALVAFLQSGWGKIPPLGPMLAPFSGVWSHPSSSEILSKSYQLRRHLKGTLTLQQDKSGIFHLFAAYDEDLYAAQGFTVASQRLFQMNFMARVAEGRLAEWAGQRAVDTDRFFQQMDLASAASKSAERMLEDPFTAMALERYAQGVNAYVEGLAPGGLPVEFKILGARPDKWSPYRTALILKLMTYLLTGSSKDVPLTRSVDAGRDLMDLDALFPLWEKSVTPSISSQDFPVSATRRERVLLRPPGAPSPTDAEVAVRPDPKNGSNNWAVNGGKSKSGYPLLAGDMHLAYQLPSQWITLHLQSSTQDVIGFSLPGAPGIVMGANRNLAWAVTNGGADVMDWHRIEWASKIEGTGLSSGKDQQYYVVGKNTRKAQHETRSIRVRGGFSVTVPVIWTHLGPVVEVKSPETQEVEYLAVHWLGHEATGEVTSFLNLNRAKSVEECFRVLEETYTTPQQNFLCVDQSNIGLKVAGQVPLRAPGEGRVVLPASDEPSWSEFVPPSHLPRLMNPERGYLFSANQQIYDEGYPYYFQWLYRSSFRARQIERFLKSQDKFSHEDFIKFQKDSYLVPAEKSLPLLVRSMEGHLEALSSEQREYLKELRTWDFQARQEQTFPSFYRLWWEHTSHQLWGRWWPSKETYQWPSFEVTLDLLQRDKIHFRRETDPLQPLVIDSHEVIRTAFDLAWKEFQAEPQKWGEANRAKFPHLLRLPPWTRQATESGARDAVHAQAGDHGASARMVVSMGSPPRIWGHHPGGPSGDPLSPQYDSWMKEWASGKLMEWSFPERPVTHTSELLFSREFGGPQL